MSRRKQARPRHVDDPDLESPAIAANSVVPVFHEDNTVEDKSEHSAGAVEENGVVNELQPDIEGDNTEDESLSKFKSHDKCQAEFLDLDELTSHKSDCLKPVMLLFKDSQEKSENQSEITNMNGYSSQVHGEQEEDRHSESPVSNSKHSDSRMNHQADSNDMPVDNNTDRENFENQSNFDNMEDEYEKSIEENDEDDAEYDDLKEEDMRDKMKSGISPAELTAYMQQLQSLIPGMNASSSSNVMLEPMEATKAAVAQFAENNPEEEKDVGKLHAALFNLQQQQLMQLQLIHQLQQQLVTGGGTQNGQQLHSALLGQLPLGANFAANFPGLNLNLPGVSDVTKGTDSSSSKPSSRHESPSPKSESVSSIKKEKNEYESQDRKDEDTTESTSNGPTTEASSKDFSSPTSLLMSVTDKIGQSSVPSSTPSHHEYSGSASKESGDGRSYLGSDDPFFKHKCRLCGKVFGSDSALQIHVRSHTGEKPFQCNICGGRFSTRGNLKVHFQRHKAEFPNVEMNPNPVPEHMDKSPMPLLGSPFPSAAALSPFANPALMMPGFMNGFMFPPPHLNPRQPMAAHSMISKPSVEERRPTSPKREPRSSEVKKDISPVRHASEPSPRSPERKEHTKSSAPSPSTCHMSKPSPVMPLTSIPLVSTYPVMSPLPSQPPFPHHRPQIMTSSSMSNNDPFRNTILPSNILDNDDNLEQFMEIDKSETSKLQQLVDNIEHKLTDPNQCVICHRVLSCKSALQMHYRIHTGERPFKCKICGRSFTTKGNLKTHMGVHRAKPPLRMMHQCPVCHKQFTNLLVLQQHIRSHTGMSGLPSIPGLNHLGMFANAHPGMEDRIGRSPLNMKRQYSDDYDKELDLSKKPRIDVDDDKLSSTSRQEQDNGDDCNDDLSDTEEQNEMDDEANKIAADEAKKEGLNTESSDGRSTPENSRDEKNGDTPSLSRSSGLDFQSPLPRSSSPKYLQEDSNNSQDGNFNAYSTSLAALEERVRQIDTTMARNPLSQFHAAPFLLAPSYSNGEDAVSPRSESGSDEGRKPSTPGSSDSNLGGNYLLGAIDGRPLDGNSKATTCNVCYKTFACRSALDIHYRSHTRERPFKCDLCDKSFTTRGNMKQHLLTHKLNDGSATENGDYESNNNNSCTPNQNDNDSDDSVDSSNVESMQDSHRQEANTSQVSKKEISTPQEKTTATSTCSLSTSASSSSRSSNIYSSSDTQSPFVSKNPSVKHQCLVCQKGFSSASALQIHIRTHTGDKPFKCTVCGKAFTTKGNLKVHMGTHMWNNSPSRRGRRMSIEPPFMLAHKENPYLPHGFPPRPEFYPFQFPPFMNGLPTPPKSLSEMAMLPGMSRLKPSLSPPTTEEGRKSTGSPSHEDKPKYAESGELDLSMKSTGSSGSRSSEKTSPSSVDSNGSSGMVSPPHMSLGWGWKASCHLCSRSFPTPVALEHHIRSMHMVGASLPKVEAS